MPALSSDHSSSIARDTPTHARPRRWFVAVIAVLLLSQLVTGALTAARLTVTHDEYWHIPVGLLHWKTGRFDWEPLNPPLLRMWSALPLLFTSADSPRTKPTTDLGRFGDEFLTANPETFDRYVMLARASMLLLTVAAGALLARWAWEWCGPWSACLVAWLWSRDPNMLAHGSLATTDAGAAACWIVVLYATWRFSVQPTRVWAVVAGLLLGLAQAAKFTNVLLVPLMIGLWLIERWRNPAVEPIGRKLVATRWGIVVLAAWLGLNSCYLLNGIGKPLREFDFQSQSAHGWQQRWGPLAAAPVPLPRDYVVGLDRQKAIMESKHPVFLDLAWSETGFPHYYLMTLLYKLPHSTHVLLLIAVGQLLWLLRARTETRCVRVRRFAWTLLPAALLVTVASTSGMQLGIRYILPGIPLLFLLIGEVAANWTWPRHRWPVVAIVMFLSIFDSWHSHPDYLAYFNEASGGATGGRAHLIDSNLDWGQDLHELKRFLDAHPIPELHLAYFGTLPPESLGIRYQLPPSWQPQPGWHAVSVNFVMGRPHGIRDGRGGMRAVGLDEFGYFRVFPIKHVAGASIDIYHLTAEDVRRWQADHQR